MNHISAAIPTWNCGHSFRVGQALGNCTAFYALGGSTPQVSHAYDAFGRRIWSKFAGDSNGRFFIYDGDLLLGEVQVWSSTSKPVTAAYTWGAAGLVSEHVFYPGNSFWYHFGPQGETRQLTNSAGQVADTYTYTAYGAGVPNGITGTNPNPFQFGGQVGYYSYWTGLVWCGSRWYQPAMGRWVSRDPIGYAGGPNLYQYCGSNPVGNVDPTGLDYGGTVLGGADGAFYYTFGATPPTIRTASARGYGGILGSWWNALGYTLGWMAGTGTTHNQYAPGSIQTCDMRDSLGAATMRAQVAGAIRRNPSRQGPLPDPNAPQGAHGRWNGVGPLEAYLNTVRQPWNGTQAQVGSFDWRAEIAGNQVHYFITNTTDVNSFFYHIPGAVTFGHFGGWGRAGWGFGPMGNVHQYFDWIEPLPR